MLCTSSGNLQDNCVVCTPAPIHNSIHGLPPLFCANRAPPSTNPAPSSAYKTLYLLSPPPCSTPHRDDDDDLDAVHSPSRRPAPTPTTESAWVQHIQQHQHDDMDMLRLLCASSPLLGAPAADALLVDIPQEAQRPFEGRGRLQVLLGGTPPAQARGQETMALYVHLVRRMLQYEMQHNGAGAVAMLVGSSTFRRSLLACCVDMIGCVYAQVWVRRRGCGVLMV